MSKGAFEKQPGKGKKKSGKSKSGKVALIVVLVVAALLVLGVGGLFAVNYLQDDGKIADNVYAAGVNLSGMTKEEAASALKEVAASYTTTDLVMQLGEADGTITAEAAKANAVLDATKAAEAAYAHGRESFFRLNRGSSGEEYVVPATEYLTVDETYLRTLAADAAELSSDAAVETTVTAQKGTGEDQRVQALVITKGKAFRKFTQEDVYNALMDCYAKAQFTGGVFTYPYEQLKPLDVDALFEQYCTEAVDAYYDVQTQSVVPEVVGYGFDKDTLQKQLDEAKEGEEFTVSLVEMLPEVTEENLQDQLFSDVLGEYDSPHTAIAARTNNLKLACEAIDGTVLMPGDEFSFNNVVGERTAAKGYQSATVYVSGESVPQLGGGVCQVASTIYYCALMADLQITDRAPHMYAVTYVPSGLDATVYWGSQDFKFKNNTQYPIRIDASVSGGYVHIKLVGTETRDYTVKLTYDVLATYAWKTVEKTITDGSHKNGEVITTPYTGYKVASYMHKYDKDGKEISTTQIAVSNYSKRDKVVAVVATTPKPTEPTPTETTSPPSSSTEPPTESSETEPVPSEETPQE